MAKPSSDTKPTRYLLHFSQAVQELDASLTLLGPPPKDPQEKTADDDITAKAMTTKATILILDACRDDSIDKQAKQLQVMAELRYLRTNPSVPPKTESDLLHPLVLKVARQMITAGAQKGK